MASNTYRKPPLDLDEVEEEKNNKALTDYRPHDAQFGWDDSSGNFPLQLKEWDCKLPPGFLLIYGGKRRSGKSVHIKWLLRQNNPDQYKLVVVMTYTPESGAYQGMVGEKWVHDGWDPTLATKLIERGKKLVAKNGEEHPDNKTLLILDDIISREFHDDKIMESIATRGRHVDIDVILTTQYPLAIGTKVRTNADVYVGFELDSGLEEDQVIKTYFHRLRGAALDVYEAYTEGYNGMVALKHARTRKVVEKFATTLADPDAEDFEMGSEKQRKAAIEWRKSKENKRNADCGDGGGDFSGDGSCGDGSGSSISERIAAGVNTAGADFST